LDAVSRCFSAINAVIFGFNLIPVPPLDGGTCCSARCASAASRSVRAAAAVISLCWLLPILFWGCWLWRDARNPTLLITAAIWF
jgi:Zn-dependent protease